MNRHRIHRLWVPLFLVTALSAGSAMAANLNDIFGVTDRLNAQAKRSQAKIDALTEETRRLLNEYKTVLKEIEGLRVYNRQLSKQIGNQETEMSEGRNDPRKGGSDRRQNGGDRRQGGNDRRQEP